MMRWKILELAERYRTLDDIIAALKNSHEFMMDEQAAMDILILYKDTLSSELQAELENK